MSTYFPPELKPQDKITDSFVVVKHLGTGGFAHTYLCEQYADEKIFIRYVVVKVMHNKYADIKEVFTVSKLDSPYIPDIYDFRTRSKLDGLEDYADQHPFIVYKYIAEAQSLDKILLSDSEEEEDNSSEVSKGIDLDDAMLNVFEDIAKAIDYAHSQKIIHRDIKPSNVLVKKETGEGWLIDFGLAQHVSRKKESYEKSLKSFGATRDYVAPELVIEEGDTFVDPDQASEFSDIYSFGVLIYKTLTGKTPFHRGYRGFADQGAPEKASSFVPWLGTKTDQVLERALAYSPTERYESCREFFEELAQATGTAREAREKYELGKQDLVNKDYPLAVVRLDMAYKHFITNPQLEPEIHRYLKEAERLAQRRDKFKEGGKRLEEEDFEEALHLFQQLRPVDERDDFSEETLHENIKQAAYQRVVVTYQTDMRKAAVYWQEFNETYPDFKERKFINGTRISDDEELVGEKLDREHEARILRDRVKLLIEKEEYQRALEILSGIEEDIDAVEEEALLLFVKTLIQWQAVIQEALQPIQGSTSTH